MRYRLIAIEGTQAVGGAAASAAEAVSKLIELESAGYRHIVIKDEKLGDVTREQLIEAAEREGREARPA